MKFLNKKHSNNCGILLPDSFANYEFNYSSKKVKNNQKHWIEYLKNLTELLKFLSPSSTVFSVTFK